MLWLHSFMLIVLLAPAIQMLSQSVSSSANIDPTARIGDFATVGDNAALGKGVIVGGFSTIGAGTILKDYSQVGSFSTVGPSARVDENGVVGDYANIAPDSVIGSKAKVGDYVSISRNVRIEPGSGVGSFAGLGNDCLVEENSLVGEYAKLANKNTVKKNSIVSSYVISNANVLFNENSYVGNFTRIGATSKIGKKAVLHEFVTIYENEQIPDEQVIVAAPNSQTLFNTVKMGLCDINKIERMAEGSDSDFNQAAQDWITNIFGKLTEQCPSGSNARNNEINYGEFPCLTAFYLMKYYGRQRFDDALSSNPGPMLLNELQREFHFGKKPNKVIFSPENQKEYVKLLAIDRDLNRLARVEGDRLCDMIDKIKTNGRPVRTSDPNYAP